MRIGTEPVWKQKVTFRLPSGEPVLAEEHFFLIRISSQTLSRDNWTPLEEKLIGGHRWWSIRALKATEEVFFPRIFPALFRASGAEANKQRSPESPFPAALFIYVECQNRNFNPNWIWRLSCRVDGMVPKFWMFAAEYVVVPVSSGSVKFGLLKIGVFNRLKNSARNCTL